MKYIGNNSSFIIQTNGCLTDTKSSSFSVFKIGYLVDGVSSASFKQISWLSPQEDVECNSPSRSDSGFIYSILQC
jgi:hypothetical protein